MRSTIYWCLIITFIVLISSFFDVASADEAPIELQGCGSHAVFVKQTNITMEMFLVNVTVDLPIVQEDYIYYLRNDANRTINQTVMVPIIFELYRSEYYYYDSKADIKIWVNEKEIEYYSVESVLLEDKDLMTDRDSYEGLVFNLSFNPFETLITHVEIRSYHEDFTSEFKYYYSSKTARYWNGTVSYSSFRFQFNGEVDWIEYSVPNGTRKYNLIYSEMHNWDGNAEYKITVNLHFKKGIPFYFIIDIIILIVIIAIVAIIIFAIVMGKRKKKENNNSEFYLDKIQEGEI